MDESTAIKNLQEQLSKRLLQCNDMRTLVEVLELLEDGFPEQPGTQDAPTVAEEPPAPYWTQGGGGFRLTQAHKDILDERGRELDSGEAKPISWDAAESQILNNLNNDG